eukprot:337535-Pelagomonas_calceolata.AAC.1
MYLDLPHQVLRNTAIFRLRVHTLQIEQAIWSNSTSPVCDIVVPMTYKMKNTCCSNVPIPRSAPSVKGMLHYLSTTSLLHLHISHKMPCLGTIHHVNFQYINMSLNQDNKKLAFFLYDLMCISGQVSSHTS